MLNGVIYNFFLFATEIGRKKKKMCGIFTFVAKTIHVAN